VCPSCGNDDASWLGKLPDVKWFAGDPLEKPLPSGSLYRCERCRLKFRYPLLDAATYTSLYDNASVSTWSAEGERRDWDLISQYLRRRFAKGASVLDFGCYGGGLLARLGTDYARYGIEINRAAAAFASNSYHVQVWHSLDEVPAGRSFDVIVLADVIEHVPDPKSLIDSLLARLTEHGALIITTGDGDNALWDRFGANWWYCFYPEHISFLSRDFLSYTSAMSGFRVDHIETFRYSTLARWRRWIASACVYAYGYFPRVYLQLGSLWNRLLGRNAAIRSVEGCGVSADHLFIALSRKTGS
jgi:SAM-dependent methyltransferase